MFNLFKMNIRDRYLGSTLGSFWAITNPLFMLALYTYVFGFVFKIKLPGAESTLVYVIWLISGYGPWIALNESIIGGSNSVVGASGLVKNMAFKTELLPIAAAFIGLISLSVSLCFLFVLLIWAGGDVTWHFLFLPLIMALQIMFAAALSLWLATITVFIRDVGQILPTMLTVIMFVTPIFYPFASMPIIIQKISLANPIYQIVESYRTVIINNQTPDMIGLVYVAVVSFIIFYFGLLAFRRAKGSFDSAL